MRPLVNRIASLRPLRPPNGHHVPSSGCHHPRRIFTTRTPLNFISHTHQRPSLPYLSAGRTHRLGRLTIRPLSTEQKDYIRYQLKLGAYWTVILWVTVGGFSVAYFVLRQDWLDRQYPGPREWSMWARKGYREAQHALQEEQYGSSMVDWSAVVLGFLQAVGLSETGGVWKIDGWQKNALAHNTDWDGPDYDFPGFTGAIKEDMRRQPVTPLFRVQKIGFDVSGQTAEYRHAYFTSLMGIAKGAEMLASKVRDTSRRLIFPRDQMIGPSNPHPRPTYPGSPVAPLEENCERAYEDPEIFYRRILTTRGLTLSQRLDAGLAYAAWVDYTGDAPRASALYAWSLSLACRSFAAAHPTVPLRTVLDPSTGTLVAGAPLVTNNLLKATTALASHHARNGDTPAALAIYLSVLRARQAAPVAAAAKQYARPRRDMSLRSVESVLAWVRSVPFGVEAAPLPDDGDEAWERTRGGECREAALMAYVGEILFASSSEGAEDRRATAVGVSGARRRREGLAWTRDAVELAERGHGDARLEAESKRVCTQCLGTAFGNWEKMLKVLVAEEEEAQKRSGKRRSRGGGLGRELWDEPVEEEVMVREETGGSSWWTWILFMGSSGGGKEMDGSGEEWKRELKAVQRRHVAFAEERMMGMLNRQIANKSDWFVV